MTSFAHTKIIETIAKIDEIPTDPTEYTNWITGERHLKFVNANGTSDEVALLATGPFTYLVSQVVPNSQLFPLDKDDLLTWSSTPDTSIASYVTGGGREGMWIERGDTTNGSKSLKGAMDLVFWRTFEGWAGADRNYFEIHQEFTHLAGIHWRPEHRAYCKYDGNGDLDKVISVTSNIDATSGVKLVSVKWDKLEDYLAVADASLVQMFDFTLLRPGFFGGWPDGLEEKYDRSDQIFFRRKIAGDAAYTRGVQILSPRRAPSEIIEDIKAGWFGKRDEKHVEFTAYDFRHGKVATVSTAPAATTNYFEAHENELPFELSPAFFKPEVLSKYKTDRDKYTVSERSVSCRAAWYLKGYDVNEAGQVHAYICDLRRLPYTEQLHWLSFNEPPKTSISERAYTNDFLGEWVHFSHPLREIISMLRQWHEKKSPLWTLRDEKLFDRVSTPLTTSTDEWAEAFMDLSKLIAEGFETKIIRQWLGAAGIAYTKDDQSILLLEKLLGIDAASGGTGLGGLRAVQRIRSKVKGHTGSSEAQQIIDDAISTFGTYSKHFEQVCKAVVDDLRRIEERMWPPV
ncbi:MULTISPECIES: hypothetical protein [Asticcacaulis]|uniref:hypothetical protein n=1 Tax=Asticcacaulis TaxID=76890 RepID=UPI001AE0FFDC|nr:MULTISPECIES: hypothetical protein [Asticcacaulis]MBP2160233.1 hypothetical protein [Asticcacaulis solisilvae]MDR6801278.1 hypothetical protein [Asticcacaulis sp. BE141]